MDAVQDLIIGFLDEADLPQLCQIEKDVNPSPWTKGNFLSSFKAGHRCLALRKDKVLLAYCIFSDIAGEAELLILAVAASWQGRGLGKKLLAAGLQQLAAGGRCKTCFLEVRESNHKAISLYESLGFNCVGERKNYYPRHEKTPVSGREHAFIYAIELAFVS